MARIIDSSQCNITGEQVKRARLKAGLSQKQLSEKLETEAVYVCRGSISRIESGVRTVTDIEIDAISKVLNVPLKCLFERTDAKR
ncbi:MAG: helix-turn-helix domain-containing protein [Oscillospiraceae bacterium]|nr:helix-turn-helix domain-containing protein [Oscillospiraceae bacterium]